MILCPPNGKVLHRLHIAPAEKSLLCVGDFYQMSGTLLAAIEALAVVQQVECGSGSVRVFRSNEERGYQHDQYLAVAEMVPPVECGPEFITSPWKARAQQGSRVMFLDAVPQSAMDGDHRQIAIDDPRSDYSGNGIPIKPTKTSEMQTVFRTGATRPTFCAPSNHKEYTERTSL
jgi:hypothetical protein